MNLTTGLGLIVGITISVVIITIGIVYLYICYKKRIAEEKGLQPSVKKSKRISAYFNEPSEARRNVIINPFEKVSRSSGASEGT